MSNFFLSGKNSSTKGGGGRVLDKLRRTELRGRTAGKVMNSDPSGKENGASIFLQAKGDHDGGIGND